MSKAKTAKKLKPVQAKTVKARAPKEVQAPIVSEPEHAPTIVAPEPDSPENCGACHYWRNEYCMRYPPVKVPGYRAATHQTVTAKDDWCGEFRALSGNQSEDFKCPVEAPGRALDAPKAR